MIQNIMQTPRPSCFFKSAMTIFTVFLMICFLLPIFSSAESAEPKPAPTTTANSEIPVKELQYRLVPLTKNDLQAEAEGWLRLLKLHAAKISQMQIDAMNADGDAKEKLLADVTKLQEQQTALIDRVKTVVEELRTKDGEVDTYDKYLKAVSGIKVDGTDAGGTWTVVTGWLMSKEDGLRIWV